MVAKRIVYITGSSLRTKHVKKKDNLHLFIYWYFYNSLPLTGEQVVIILPQFNGSLIELPGTLPGLWTQPGPHVLHTLFVIGI